MRRCCRGSSVGQTWNMAETSARDILGRKVGMLPFSSLLSYRTCREVDSSRWKGRGIWRRFDHGLGKNDAVGQRLLSCIGHRIILFFEKSMQHRGKGRQPIVDLLLNHLLHHKLLTGPSLLFSADLLHPLHRDLVLSITCPSITLQTLSQKVIVLLCSNIRA